MDWSDLRSTSKTGNKNIASISFYGKSKNMFIGKKFKNMIKDNNFAKILFSNKNNSIVILVSAERLGSGYNKISSKSTGTPVISCNNLFSIIGRENLLGSYPVSKETIVGLGECYVVYLDKKINKEAL